jgi:hypothetical protein
MAQTTWLQYYQSCSDVEPGTNPIKALLVTTMSPVITEITKSHLNKPDRFRSTISGNCPGSMVIVPTGGGMVQLLHHRTLFAKFLGMDPLALFVTGNRVSAPIKILNIEEVCLAIGVGNSAGTTWVKPVNIPSDDNFFKATSPTLFTNLKGEEKESPLNDRPNHMLLYPRTFELTEGAQSMDASLLLAFKIIENIQELSSSAETEEDRMLLEQEKESKHEGSSCVSVGHQPKIDWTYRPSLRHRRRR